jgi:hypothetical protein
MKKILIVGQGRIKKFDINKILNDKADKHMLDKNDIESSNINRIRLDKKMEENIFDIEKERSL